MFLEASLRGSSVSQPMMRQKNMEKKRSVTSLEHARPRPLLRPGNREQPAAHDRERSIDTLQALGKTAVDQDPMPLPESLVAVLDCPGLSAPLRTGCHISESFCCRRLRRETPTSMRTVVCTRITPVLCATTIQFSGPYIISSIPRIAQ